MKQTHVKLESLFAPLRRDEISLAEGCSLPTEHEHPEAFTTVREATHRDKTIEIHTTYRILIDGEPLLAHTSVLDDGTVHCHGLPQYSFLSAMDMARKIIDASDVELPDDELGEDHTKHYKEEEK